MVPCLPDRPVPAPAQLASYQQLSSAAQTPASPPCPVPAPRRSLASPPVPATAAATLGTTATTGIATAAQPSAPAPPSAPLPAAPLPARSAAALPRPDPPPLRSGVPGLHAAALPSPAGGDALAFPSVATDAVPAALPEAAAMMPHHADPVTRPPHAQSLRPSEVLPHTATPPAPPHATSTTPLI
ncbi:skin secretory protein xP2-like [Vidua macroura]|uniref:skin secretory protein xP2-like n=1 Tax=Vidua macroura TaxID=187451 RepID=UPI0023A87761|nr:skin secretory protein xP2-like [Vidua macroura]